MEIERRFFEMRTDGVRKIIGHAALFNSLSQDLGGFRETIAAGAFSESIKTDDVRALFNHDPNYILGRTKSGTLELSEDEIGLAIKLSPPDTQFGRDLLNLIQRGDVSQMSFGFSVNEDGSDWTAMPDGAVVRTLRSVKLWDVSPVVYPAYLQTDIAVRSMLAWGKQNEQKNENWKIELENRKRRLMLSEMF